MNSGNSYDNPTPAMQEAFAERFHNSPAVNRLVADQTSRPRVETQTEEIARPARKPLPV